MKFNDTLIANATDDGVLLWDFRNTSVPRAVLRSLDRAPIKQILLDDYKVVAVSSKNLVTSWNLFSDSSRVLAKDSSIVRIGMDRSNLYTLGNKLKVYKFE